MLPTQIYRRKVAVAGRPIPARKLEGKVALITGGASGIGECTARLFVEHGARVVVSDIQDEAGARLCAELGAVVCYVHCDVAVEDDVAAAVDHAVATFGALDVIFNNAGIGGPASRAGIRERRATDLERVLSVNLVGPFLGAKHAARVMVPARRGGCIISTASLVSAVAGLVNHAYTCSKRALAGLTESLAAELGRHGIRVNCVSPSGAATPLAVGDRGLGREGFEKAMEALSNLRAVGGSLRVDDVAAAVLFLASDDARHISGHNLLIDGGISVAVHPSMGVFNVD